MKTFAWATVEERSWKSGRAWATEDAWTTVEERRFSAALRDRELTGL
jgi:hypothetical protein